MSVETGISGEQVDFLRSSGRTAADLLAFEKLFAARLLFAGASENRWLTLPLEKNIITSVLKVKNIHLASGGMNACQELNGILSMSYWFSLHILTAVIQLSAPELQV